MGSPITDIERFEVGTLKVEVYPTRAAAGEAAAQAAARALRDLAHNRSIGVIFATGASQLETLDSLTRIQDVPWKHIRGFHLDEYVGIPADHPASFRKYLRQRLTEKVSLHQFHEINGSSADTEAVCRTYAEDLAAASPALCFLGIGENGHLAFNDPGIADFADVVDVKVVHLDPVSRNQQVAEGWFSTFQDTAESAITVTMPALFRVPKLIVSVPGKRKAQIMKQTLTLDISTKCPSTILRTHPDATVYLDQDSAAELHSFWRGN
ncbi:Glucosamine-6-phosphate deaminase [Acidisarcina polymorpha]|uniref:Glucosamine-6-phosphate deaminase n=1 Tax=Acidisarcina polymorpha TaxID=2211140 RepID=A0A2Z5G1G7_9BACT|nr:6-phosphogluconolactonase [Acidisarcina polymorpha]AXC12644.1 Glucosamine-6-phosphate deaminase [Acidisarcina polymorpha]